MTSSWPSATRRFRAPALSGDRLIHPPIVPRAEAPADAIETLLDNNRLLRAAFDTRIGDMRLWELVAATRREVLTVAAEYTGSYRDVERPRDVADWIARPIIMGGHQPELFHAGVWLKNSALDAYARHVGGTAVNLIVDTDRCHHTGVGVPVGTPEEARLEQVPFDGPGPDMAWEERGILDDQTFASFGDRCCDLLCRWSRRRSSGAGGPWSWSARRRRVASESRWPRPAISSNHASAWRRSNYR